MIIGAVVDRFQRDGAHCIRQLIDAHQLAELRAGIELNLAHLSPRAPMDHPLFPILWRA